MHVSFLTLARSEIPHNVTLFAFAPHLILVDYQSLEPYRPPRMNLPRADTYLCAEPIPKPISKPCARVDKGAS